MDKKHILDEIRRTAVANDGVPLGVKRFLSVTGINRSDWFGIHWARWSDAVIEAGLAPNQLSVAYDIADLLGKYADLALEIGRLPADADLRFKSRNAPGFPSNSTFDQIGSKAELVSQLREYCRGREAYEDVIRFCDEYTPRKKQDEAEEKSFEEGAIGFVYLVKSGKFYKIGMTNSIGRREYELGIQLPERSTTIHVIRTDDPEGIEDYWHRRFAQKRKNGEWFALTGEDVAIFKRRKFM